MASSFFATGYIINPLGALNLEWHLLELLGKREIASLVKKFRKLDYLRGFHGWNWNEANFAERRF